MGQTIKYICCYRLITRRIYYSRGYAIYNAFIVLLFAASAAWVVINLYSRELHITEQYSRSADWKKSGKSPHHQSSAFLIDLPGCTIPKFDPWSSQVAQFFQSVKNDFKCPGRPSFLKVVNFTTIKIDFDTLHDFYRTDLDSCIYGHVLRDDRDTVHPDEGAQLFEPNNSIFRTSITSNADFVYVECKNDNGSVFFDDFKALMPARPSVEARIKEERSEGLSIMVIGLDSISKLNFIRHNRRTYKLLKELNAIELHGYTKVGENTLLNVMPLLTGVQMDQIWSDSFYDDHNFIWKEFSRNGYRTLYAEDGGTVATFNYKSYGFKNPPTDYYYRPLVMALESWSGDKEGQPWCVKNEIQLVKMLDWTSDFHRRFKDGGRYSFSWSNSMTHDFLNYVGYTDNPISNFLTSADDLGILNNTVVIFISDHGIRWGDIVDTRIGKYEERMPFAFLVFPQWFRERYPRQWENLQANQHRLTTPFELYKTQWDILYLSRRTTKVPEGRGISLFDEIPVERTCDDAQISPHWCVCDPYEELDPSSAHVHRATKHAIFHLNNMVADFKDLCAVLSLKSVLNAEVHTPADRSLGVNYRVVFLVEPSGGKFEATVQRKESQFKVLGDVSRINKYGKQSRCVSEFKLKPVCFCRGL